jgi:hypothetical protein
LLVVVAAVVLRGLAVVVRAALSLQTLSLLHRLRLYLLLWEQAELVVRTMTHVFQGQVHPKVATETIRHLMQPSQLSAAVVAVAMVGAIAQAVVLESRVAAVVELAKRITPPFKQLQLKGPLPEQ